MAAVEEAWIHHSESVGFTSISVDPAFNQPYMKFHKAGKAEMLLLRKAAFLAVS